MANELKEAAKKMLEVRDYDVQLRNFARKKYNERFQDILEQGWRAFHDYTILDENTIAVEYKYGMGDYEYDHSFNVKLDLSE